MLTSTIVFYQIPEAEDVLEWVAAVNGNCLVACYLRDVKNVLELHDLGSGNLIQNLPLEVGSIRGFSGRRKDNRLFFKFVSFLSPGTIYSLDLSNAKPEPEVFREIEVAGFDRSMFEAKQEFFTSKDGTKVPCFLVSRKDMKRGVAIFF